MKAILKKGDFWLGFVGIVPFNYILWLLLASAYASATHQMYYVPTPLIWVWHTVANVAWVATALVLKRPFIFVGALSVGIIPLFMFLAVGACVLIFGMPRF